jgi:hypothetical protein
MLRSSKGGSIVQKKRICRMGSAVVAGGLMFVGQAAAGPVINENFESSPSGLFGTFGSYAYSQNYTSVNIPPDGLARYYTGNPEAATSRSATVPLTIDLNPEGLPAAVIDAGLAQYELSAWFSTYLDQNDWSSVRVQFFDGANGLLEEVEIGGVDFVAALGLAPNGDDIPNYRDWGLDVEGGILSPGARSVDITLFTQRQAGTAGDGYLDVVQLNLTAVPEPTSLGLLGGAGLLALRRRRR